MYEIGNKILPPLTGFVIFIISTRLISALTLESEMTNLVCSMIIGWVVYSWSLRLINHFQ